MKKYKNAEALMIKMSILKRFAFVLLLVFAISLASSQLENYGTKQVNTQFTFCQVCNDATYLTLSSIETPTSTIQINSNMSAQGAGQFCYNYTPTLIGRYDFRGISDGCEKSFATYADVTYTGDMLTSEQSYIYFIALIFLVALIFALGYFNSKINGEDSRNEDNEIISINFKGFLRPVIYSSMWILGVTCVYIIANLGLAFLPNAMMGNLFFKIYQVLFWITIIAVPVGCILLFVQMAKALEYQKILKREGLC